MQRGFVHFVFRLSDRAYKQATLKNIFIFLMLFLLFNVVVIPYYIQQITPDADTSILDVRFGFSSADAYETLEAIGQEGRNKYLFFLAVIDSIYPLVYGSLLILTAGFLLRRTLNESNDFRILNLVAIDAVIFDYLENLGIIYMISRYPSRADGVATLASVSGMIKWIMIILAICVILFGLIGYIRGKLKQPQHHLL